jgi:hypothetical protein
MHFDSRDNGWNKVTLAPLSLITGTTQGGNTMADDKLMRGWAGSASV